MSAEAVLAVTAEGAAVLTAIGYAGRQLRRLVIKLDAIAATPTEVATLRAIVERNTAAIEGLTEQMARIGAAWGQDG